MSNPTNERSRQWLTLADSIASVLGDGGPLAFVIGAGASLSSGAPSSAKLEQRWMDSDPDAYPNREALLKKLCTLSDVQKINPIKELFGSKIRPFIGYHCLAALAHERAVFVVNLNWDDALEQACAAVSVPFHHLTVDRTGDLVFTVEENGEKRRVRGAEFDGSEPPVLTDDPSPGVYCLQAHGKLGDTTSGIRIGVYDTLKFTPIVKRTIVNRFLCHPTVIVGASLQGEYDIVDLLRTLTNEPAELPELLSPFYMFSRQETRTDQPTDKLTQQVLYKHSSDFNFRGDPAVDFDRLLLDLATRVRGVDFQAPFDRHPLPSLEHLALPHPKVLNPPFHASDHHALVIEGDACVGRTVAAGLLGHMARLCEKGETSVEIFSGSPQCAEALSNLDPDAEEEAGAEAPKRVLILENPFGLTGGFRENKRFARAFDKHLKAKPAAGDATRTRVIVTSRASNWRRALTESKVSPPDKVISLTVDDWYRADELTGYLESKVARRDKPLLRREIHKGELATPAVIDDAVFKGSDRREEMIEEKVEFLDAISTEAAWCAVRARLQELWPNGVADLPLHSAADRASDAFAEAKLMLRTAELDGQTYVVLAHSIDREAIDRFFAERFAVFEGRLTDLSRAHGSPKDACELWRAMCELREGDLDRFKALPEEVRLNWGPALLEEASRCPDEETAKARFTEVRGLLLGDSQHFWSMRELVFETIRLWPLLKGDRATHRFLDEVLSDEGRLGGLDSRERMGRYLVLEAMLYVQAATYPGTWDMAAYTRVWDELSAARYSLFDEPEENIVELALIFDAFAWCPPRLEPHELRRWLEPLMEVAVDCPQLRTAMLCSSILHPEGFELLARDLEELGMRVEEHRFSQEDADIAAFMISWHFVHQSRSRALLYRRSLEPAHAYLLHRIPGPLRPTLAPRVAERCKRLVAELSRFPEHTGWAVHLAMSVAVQRRGFDASFAARHVAALRDGDQGAIAAAMTYDIPPVLRASFLEYFGEEANRDALLDAMSQPHEIDGVAIGPPPFCASRLPWQLYGSLEIEWEFLEEDGISVSDEYAFLEMLHSAAADLGAGAEDESAAEAVRLATREAASGDLRRLEAVPHRLLSDQRSRMSPSELLADRLAHVADEIHRGAS